MSSNSISPYEAIPTPKLIMKTAPKSFALISLSLKAAETKRTLTGVQALTILYI